MAQMQTITQDVKIRFNTDTNAAKQQIQGLYDNLIKISNINPLNTNMTGSISQLQAASRAASELTIHLKNATNVNTGRLNLKTFTNSLAQSGRTLSSFKTQLTAIGPEGTRTFQQLTQAIMMAEKPLFSMNSALKSLGTTLLNSAKWQISSMAIHGIMGAAQKATGHIKALNNSLNDIRIVSGQSAEAMDKFAQKANRMAKELNTTTTAYTDAALIFYQQGLDDSAVEERVNTVIKMANVTGEAAEDVSSYMTAVWNNFDDGTKSLEYYSDAMTALGAATASSTAEIAAGLEKFAAIADTVGLSYEYATSALATVVAETRQSADVVGTAFKTIFSRLESLQLGENLDDGTTLNKYSAALATVGVNIKDQQGQLKDMDQILDELGGKWQSLSRDQQVALAQTVAGTRQYTQLISLMENYETFKSNVDIASGSEGTLQEQADIYADSWEAASKRVKASAETIYQSLLDDDFFIDLNNGFATFLDSISLLIDGMGGLKGILPVVSSLLFSMFGTQIAGYIDTMSLKVQNFGIHFTNLFRSAGNKKLDVYEQQRQQAGQMYSETISTNGGVANSDTASTNLGQQARLDVSNQLKNNMVDMIEYGRNLTGIEKELYDQQLERYRKSVEEVEEAGKKTTELEKQVDAQKKLMKENKLGGESLFASRQSESKVFSKSNANNLQNTLSKTAESVGVDKDKIQTIEEKKGKTKGVKFDTSQLNGEESQKIKNALLNEYLEKTNQVAIAQGVFNDELSESNELQTNLNTLAQARLDDSAKQTSMEGNIQVLDPQSFENTSTAIEKALLKANSFTKTLENSGKTLQQAFGKKGADAFKTYRTNLDKANKSAQNAKKVSKELNQAKEEAAKAEKKYGTNSTQHGKAMQKVNDIQKQYNATMSQMRMDAAAAAKSQKSFSDSIKEIGNDAEKAKSALQALGYNDINFGAFEQATKDMNISMGELIQKIQDGEIAIEQFQNKTEKPLTMGQQLTQIASGLSQVAMGINAVKSIGNIWSDEDASIGEKILSTAMALPMVLSSIATVTQLLTSAEKANNKAKQEGIATDAVSIKVKGAKTAATTVESGATWANTVANIANLLSSPWTWALAAIALAAIAAVTASIGSQTQALEDKAAAEKESAEAAEENANKAKEAYDNLKSSIEDYTEAQSALNELTRGTEEWRDALRDANQSALDLISTYPELAKYANWNNGVLEIDQDGMNAVLDEYKSEMIAAEQVSAVAKINSKQAQANLDKHNMQKEMMGSGWETYGNWMNGLQNFVNPAELIFGDGPLGDIASVLTGGWLTGGLFGSQEDYAREKEQEQQKEFDKALEAIEKARDEGTLKFDENGQMDVSFLTSEEMGISEDLAKALAENTEAVLKQIDTQNALIEAEKAAVKTQVAEQYANKEGFQDSEYKDAIAAFASNGAYEAGQEAYDDTLAEDWATDYGIFGDKMSKAGEKAVQEYMSSLGVTDYEITDAGENPVVEYINEAGETIEKTVTKEAVAAMRQAQAQSEFAEKNYETIMQATDKLAQSDVGKSMLKAYGEGNAMNVRGSDLQNLSNTSDAIDQLTDEELKAMGFEDDWLFGGQTAKEKFAEEFTKMQEEAEKERNRIETSTTNSMVADMIQQGDVQALASNLTTNEYKDFVDQLNALSVEFGAEGAQKFIDETSKLKEAFKDNENIDAFIGEISDMDLTSEDSAAAIEALAEQYNISGDALDTFINSMDEFVLTTNASADNLRSKIASVNKVMKDMEYGKNISSEDYQNLLDTVGNNIEQYFTQMSDGTYTLIGSAEEFYNLVNENRFNEVDNNIESTQHEIDQLERQRELAIKGNDTDFRSWGAYEAGKSQNGYIEQGVADQIQYLKDLQAAGVDIGVTAEQFKEWEDDLNGSEDTMTHEHLLAISEAVKNNTKSLEEYDTMLEEQNEILQDNINLRASMAMSLDELDQMVLEGKINTEAYNKALDGVIISELQKLEIDVAEYEAYYKTIEAMGIAEEQAKKIAASNLKLNKGVSTLADNWEEWSKELATGSKVSSQYAIALQGMKDALSMILDIDADKLSEDFYESAENLELIGKAAEGDTEAIAELQTAAATDIVINATINSNTKDVLSDALAELQTELPDLEFGATLDSTAFGAALMQLLADSKISVEQAQDILNSLGFEPEIDYVPVKYQEGMEASQKIYDKDGNLIEDVSTYLDSNGTVYVPRINAKKTHYQGPPSASLNQSNKKSDSGGGGKEKKKVEDEAERYHKIEREIDRLEKQTSRLAEAKDMAFGANKVALINQEAEALENELDALEKLNAEIEAYYAQDKANIAQFGAEFDEYGNISNYDEMIANAVEQYNSGAWSDEKYEAFKEYLEQYEETLDKWYDNQDNMTAKQREIVEKRLEGITVGVEVNLELSEDSLEYLEYQLSKIEDEAFAAADAIALITEQVDVALKDSQTYQEGLAGLEALAAQNVADGIAVDQGGWTQDMIDQAREYKSALLETNQQLEEYRKAIEEKVTTALDEMNEKLDEQIGRFDTYSSILGHYTTILGLSGKSIKNSSLIIDLGNKTVDNSINKLEATRHKQETLEKALVDAQAQYQAALNSGDAEAVEYWKETVEDITMQVEQGKEALLATFEETLQTAADTFAAAVEQTVAVLSASLTQYSSLEQAQDQYEKQKEIAERFLDVNTQNYELSKLMRNINSEIDKTDNLAAKTKLRDVLEEINDIQASNAELTQYDLDMLNAKYQLRLAEIALEEAQNAKSQVRLTQTAGGGWGYVYTADQAKIDQAEQSYEDKLYEMQKLSQDRVTELSDYILQNQQEMNDAIANLRAEDFESREAYLAEIDRIRDYYLEKDQYLHEQLGKAVEDSGQKYSDTMIAQIEGAESWEEAHQNVVDAVNEAIDGEDGLVSHYDNWETQVSKAYKAAGTSEDTFKNKVITDSDTIISKSDEIGDSVEQMAKDYSTYLTNVMTAVTKFQQDYNSELSKVITENENIVTSMNNMITKFNEVATQAQETAKQIQIAAAQAASANWGAGGSGGDGSYIPDDDEDEDDDKGKDLKPNSSNYTGPITISENTRIYKDKNGNRYIDKPGGGYVWYQDVTRSKLVSSSSRHATYYVKDIFWWGGGGSHGSSSLQPNKFNMVSQYDTGGYTGEWGSEGRMAMLHEKEIVLNKMDTANLLASVEIVRSIAQSIDAISQYQRMVDLISVYGGIVGNNAQQLEQNVHITADFPNVTDHNEIEEAFNNLINYSSQYMNRYK